MPRIAKPLTNAAFTSKLMDGALTPEINRAIVQAFVLDALVKYAALVAASKPEDYPPSGLIHPQAWIDAGTAVKKALDKHLN